MMTFMLVAASVGLLWLLFFTLLAVAQRAQENAQQARRLRRRINQIASFE